MRNPQLIFFNCRKERWIEHSGRYSRTKVTAVNNRAGDDRERVNSEMHYRIELIAHRDNLNLENPAERAGALRKSLGLFLFR